MGQLIVSAHISIDGIIGPRPDHWALLEGEHERASFDQLLAADAFLLGGKVYAGLASVWPSMTDDTGYADRVNGIPKHVASRTLSGSLDWNATLIEGDLATEVARLKVEHRGNLLSYGCGGLATELVRLDLVDEVQLFVQPVVVGEGERVFHGHPVRLRLLSSTTYASGVTLQTYRPISSGAIPERED